MPAPAVGRVDSAAVIYRVISLVKPTFLLDEADTYVSGDNPDRNSSVAIINSGHERNGMAWRMVGEGRAMEPVAFPTFAPMAIAGIGKLKDTIVDRSITIRLQRRLKGEKLERFELTDISHIEELARKAARWAVDNREAVHAAQVKAPDALNDREADNWRTLLKIAAVLSPEWLKKAEATAIALAAKAGSDDDDGGAAVQVLADCRGVFGAEVDTVLTWEAQGERERTLIKSTVLVKKLRGLEGRPWGNQDRPLSLQRLKRLLGGFGIHSERHEFGTVERHPRPCLGLCQRPI